MVTRSAPRHSTRALIMLYMRMNRWLLVTGLGFLMAAEPTAPGAQTTQDRIRQYGAAVARRWAPYFELAGVAYPPRAVTLVGLKQERLLEVYAGDTNSSLRFIRSYPVLAASGKPGPKLQEGDFQVPEGLYRIEALNPNSAFHLSLRINYPNEDDRARAVADKRNHLGGDIMIHGNAVSVGCLAMGDEAAEDLFVLAALTGLSKVNVILSPVDFRERDLPKMPPGTPKWTAERYASIKAALSQMRKPNSKVQRTRANRSALEVDQTSSADGSPR
jgi:hypothetical protein